MNLCSRTVFTNIIRTSRSQRSEYFSTALTQCNHLQSPQSWLWDEHFSAMHVHRKYTHLTRARPRLGPERWATAWAHCLGPRPAVAHHPGPGPGHARCVYFLCICTDYIFGLINIYMYIYIFMCTKSIEQMGCINTPLSKLIKLWGLLIQPLG